MAEWVRALAWAGDRTVSRPGSNPATVTSLRNFGNSVYPALPVSFGGDTKSRRSLLSGVYARGSKRSHQSALECVTVVDSTTHSKLPDPQSAIMRRKTLPCTCIGRRRRRRRTPNIDNITGSAILSIPRDRESCDHARDQQRVTPGGFRRTRPPLPDLKFIRSNFFCVNTARLYRIGKSDTLPDMVIRHKYV